MLSEILNQIAKEEKFHSGLQRQKVFNAFDLVIGKSAASYVISHELKRGVLYCTMGSSVVRSELYPSLERIRKGVNSALQDEIVKKIVLR
jgi:hypothetical protein